MSTRRDFLKLLPFSAAGVWAGGIGLPSLLASLSSRAEAAQGRSSATRPFIMPNCPPSNNAANNASNASTTQASKNTVPCKPAQK
jgi:hypothetical protein